MRITRLATVRRRRKSPARLRIAFVSDAVHPFNSGGKETRLREISSRLASRGHDVHVYTMRWWTDGSPTICLDGVTIHALCPMQPLYHNDRRSMREALLFGMATLRMIAEPFDVMDVDHMPFFPLFSARLVCSLRRRPLLGTWHEVWGRDYWRAYLGRAGALGALSERLAFSMPDRIVSNSPHTTARLLDQKVNRPITTLTLGVDADHIAAVPPAGVTSDTIFAGRLLPNKNVALLLEAVRLLVHDRPELRCLIVGEGPARVDLEALASRLGIAASVTFLDFLPAHDDVLALMKQSKVFVLPSVREGFGIVVLEANACGLPVVTVDHPENASRDLVEDGRNGFVVAVDAAAIAAAIEKCLDAADSGALTPASGIRDDHDWSAVVTRFEEVLREVTAGPQVRAWPFKPAG